MSRAGTGARGGRSGRRGRRGRRGTALAAVVAVAALLGGCAGLSRSGPVEPGLEVGSANPPDVRFTFPGPVEGAGQESMVRGFLRAGAASDGAYENARAFLTAPVSERWNPDRAIVLLADDTAPSARLLDTATVEVTARAAGTVDAEGRFTAVKPGSTVKAVFRLSTVGGEWRLSELPEGFGRWIARSDVSRLVQPYALHYVSTSRRALVPDVRWFPSDKLATRLARAQLAAVPVHLRGAATTAVPAGARLLGDAVSVDSGVATVNLISARLGPGEALRQNLWAQFVGTLTQDASVNRVALSVDGVPVDLAGLDASAGTLAEVGFATPPGAALPAPVVRRGNDVVGFDPASTEQDPRQPATPVTYPPVDRSYRHLALSADGTELATADPGEQGVSRWRGTNRYEVPLDAGDVGSPAYDRRGWLWLGAVSGEGPEGPRLWVVDTRADPADPEAARARGVSASWLDGRRVLEARVAPDGDRVAVLSVGADGAGHRIDLAGIRRGGGGVPQSLASPLRLAVPVVRAVSLAWLDDRTLATLAVLDGRTLQPTVLTVGGEVRPLAAVRDAVAITATGGERELFVTTASGRLFAREGSQWVDNGPADDLAVPAG
ncbi:LpqB family beta-propeller domain-containing protein [Oryzobacter sp. R7]|uniref:LpqB family beta-propeller domain-containing protein n=1 Tax=Oryzobacter faecalis TaxID=3388656 RepID=UPI00398D5F10